MTFVILSADNVVITNSNIERNSSFGTYKCENFQARLLCSLARVNILDADV